MNTLREALTAYLGMRRNLGFKLVETGRGLYDFISFLEIRRASYITKDLALEWSLQPTSAQPAHWARRLTWVRGFAKHRRASDPRTEIPPVGLLPFRAKRVTPYLYSDEEIQRLMEAALHMRAKSRLRGLLFYSLFGLLAVTGLRISEALNLKIEDVDLADGLLVVRGTKFGKSRIVPLHPSTVRRLSDYEGHREQSLNGRSATFFFISSTGEKLDMGEVHRTFYRLSREIGLRLSTSSSGPRLHDFRHRFAVTTLVRWYRDGDQPERLLPVLSTYLGHVHVSDTYWYLTAFPELLGEAVKRLEDRWEVKP